MKLCSFTASALLTTCPWKGSSLWIELKTFPFVPIFTVLQEHFWVGFLQDKTASAAKGGSETPPLPAAAPSSSSGHPKRCSLQGTTEAGKELISKSDLQTGCNKYLYCSPQKYLSTTKSCCEPRLAPPATEGGTHSAPALLTQECPAALQGMAKLLLFPYSSAQWSPAEMRHLQQVKYSDLNKSLFA